MIVLTNGGPVFTWYTLELISKSMSSAEVIFQQYIIKNISDRETNTNTCKLPHIIQQTQVI